MAHKILKHEETMDLIKKAQSGDKAAKDRLMEHNTRLIWNVVKKFKGQSQEDLFQIGAIGLLKSIDKFDSSFGVQFSTYAVPMMIGEIQRFLRDDGPLKVSRNIKAAARKILRLELKDREPEEIAEILEIDNIKLVENTLEYIRTGAGFVKSMEEKVFDSGEGDDITLKDQLEDNTDDNWFDKLAVTDAINELDDRLRLIVYLRYYEDKPQQEIADRLGISQVRVSRLEKEALTQVKENYSTEEELKMSRPSKGNKEVAKKLLESTSMTLKEISKESGYSEGTLCTMAKKYRPKHVTEANRKMPKNKKKRDISKEPGPVTTYKVSPVGTEDNRIQTQLSNETVKPDTQAVEGAFDTASKSTIVSVTPEKAVVAQQKQQGTVVSFDFNFEAAGDDVSREEAVTELRNTADLLEHLHATTVSFKVKVGS
jgi:RNA polymerase sporulation-specific sigma factor